MTKQQYQDLKAAAAELLAAIDKKWEDETPRRRENAISPRQEEAMERLRELIVKDGDQ